MITLSLTETEADFLQQTLADASIEAEREMRETQKPLYADFLLSYRQAASDISDKLTAAGGWKKA